MASHGWRTQRKDDDDSDRSWRRCTSAARSSRRTGRCIYARNLCMTEHAIGSTVQFRVLSPRRRRSTLHRVHRYTSLYCTVMCKYKIN